MKYSESTAEKVTYDFDSLVEAFGLPVLVEIANHAYGREIETEDAATLYNHLYREGFLDNFLDGWYFKANFYNLYKYEPDTDEIEVN